MEEKRCGTCKYYFEEHTDDMCVVGICTCKLFAPYRNESAKACRKYEGKEKGGD